MVLSSFREFCTLSLKHILKFLYFFLDVIRARRIRCLKTTGTRDECGKIKQSRCSDELIIGLLLNPTSWVSTQNEFSNLIVNKN